jgi:hypothetical protein
MALVLWLVAVWQLCLWPLAAREPGWIPDAARMERNHPRVPEHRLESRQPWAGAVRKDCPCPCLTALPRAGPAPPHRHGSPRAGEGGRPKPALQGAMNLVEEVHRIELNDPFGIPWGTFR